MTDTNRTYLGVAADHDMDEDMTTRFVNYMRARWESEEHIQCLTGYADEWAERFVAGIEYAASDQEGRAILLSHTKGV